MCNIGHNLPDFRDVISHLRAVAKLLEATPNRASRRGDMTVACCAVQFLYKPVSLRDVILSYKRTLYYYAGTAGFNSFHGIGLC